MVINNYLAPANHFSNVSAHNGAFIKVSEGLKFQSGFIIDLNPGILRMQMQMPTQIWASDPCIASSNKTTATNEIQLSHYIC